MNHPLRCLLAAAILGTSVPRVVSADPVTVTSGLISVARAENVPSPIQLAGTDGTLAFSLMGTISPAADFDVWDCKPCFGTTTISLDITSTGPDLSGTLNYGNDSYRVGSFTSTFGNAFLDLSGFAVLPSPPSSINQLATITGSFQINFAGFSPPFVGGPFEPRNSLVGSGVATVSLFVEDRGTLLWSLSSAEYRFAEPAPIPEPASFVLLASGLTALAQRRRKGR